MKRQPSVNNSGTSAVCEEFVSRNITTAISHGDKVRLDSELTLQELTNALHRMKKGKTPGSNGFPV